MDSYQTRGSDAGQSTRARNITPLERQAQSVSLRRGERPGLFHLESAKNRIHILHVVHDAMDSTVQQPRPNTRFAAVQTRPRCCTSLELPFIIERCFNRCLLDLAPALRIEP